MIFYNITKIRQKSLIRWAKRHNIDFPDKPTDLDKITHLNMRFKAVEQIPREIKFLVNLEEINAEYNNISDIPWEFGALKKIRVINLAHNRLVDIPGVICKNVQLKELNLEGNLIKKIPAIIANLINLESLNLAFNQIAEIPSEFKYLVSLKKLDLVGNRLSFLPSSFSKLPSLNEIKIWENLFESIPKELEKISSITNIELQPDKERINHLFIEAVKYDDVTTARKYLAFGADINYKWQGHENEDFTTPLFVARSVEMIKFLLENGADVHVSRMVKKHETFIFWESEKQERETFLTKKHSPEVTKYLKSINLIND